MSQRAIEISKISDLKSVKNGDCYEWRIDGEDFVYRSGDDYLKGRASLSSPWEIWPLTGNTKTAANKKVFELVK